MADKEVKKSEAKGDDEPKKSKKGLFLGGGIVGLVGVAYALSFMAVPKQAVDVPIKGPFVIDLTQERVQVNLAKTGGKRFMVMTLKAEYVAYDEAYAAMRVADPVYQANEKHMLIHVGRQKTIEDLEDPIGSEMFMQELREVIDPLLFPVHVGNKLATHEPHEASGLLPGASETNGTLRSGFYDHTITMDGPGQTLQLDDGKPVKFQGDESDLLLENEAGDTVHVDVRRHDPEFQGEVNVGTFGRIRRILHGDFIFQ